MPCPTPLIVVRESSPLLDRGRAAAAGVAGLDALMASCGLEDRLAAAGAWCVEHGWASVAHLRSGGTKAADALVSALRLKADGARARRLKRELRRDEFGWDAHAAAVRTNATTTAARER